MFSFFGRICAFTLAGYMEGAIEAGERAAREVLHQLGRLDDNQIYQSEPFQQDFIPDPPIDLPWLEQVLPSVGTFLWYCVYAAVALVACVAMLVYA